MKSRLKACLVLGCNGSIVKEDFCLCRGVQNTIIDLTNLEDEHYIRILDFLDQACDLFSSPVYDYNKCVNVLSLLYRNYDGFNQQTLMNVQAFLKTHRSCGIWIMLIMKEDIGRNYE